MALGLIWALNIGIAVASLVLLAGVLYVYARNFRECRSSFALGLTVFAGLFAVQNVLACFFYLDMGMAGVADQAALPMLVLSGAELGALAALFVVTWQ